MCPNRKRQAFSVLELVIASGLFLMLLGIVFFFFRYGTRAFITANQRQGVQADALRVMDGLQADLKRTASKSVLILNNSSRLRTIDTVSVHRDAISLISLKDWSDPNNTENFDLAGSQPKWNRYWIYYATTNEDRGAMIRLCRDDPKLNNFDGSTPLHSYLCRNLYEFKADRDGNNSFRLSLKLQEKRQLRPDGGVIQGMETYQLQMFVRPENTFPQDLTNL